MRTLSFALAIAVLLAVPLAGAADEVIFLNSDRLTGKVFSREELLIVARLCQQWDVVAITDEIYDRILYDGAVHVPLATLDGMAERTVTINSLSKTFSVTGWRVGWAISPASLASGIRKVHDFLTVGAPAPLQEAAITALGFGQEYYVELLATYRAKRALIETSSDARPAAAIEKRRRAPGTDGALARAPRASSDRRHRPQRRDRGDGARTHRCAAS